MPLPAKCSRAVVTYLVATLLEQHVLTCHAQVGGAVLDVGRNVGRTHDDEAHFGAVAADDELARGLRVLGRRDACASQERQRLVEDAALGEGNGERKHGAGPGEAFILPDRECGPAGRTDYSPPVSFTRRIVAPSAESFCSIFS